MALPTDIAQRLRMPAMVAPMFLVSGVDLVVASCKAGLIGTLTRNHCRSDEEFEEQLRTVSSALRAARDEAPDRLIGPVAANISIGSAPETFRAALASCARHEVGIIVTAGGDPGKVVSAVHDTGARLFHDVTSLRFAEKAIAAGVDGMIAIGAGGGGHSGTVSHLALVPAIRVMFDGVIVMAGAVASGAAIRAAELLGADLAYLGTRFIATRESLAADAYKAMLVSEQPGDLVYTGAINGVPAMWLARSMRERGLDPANLPVPVRGSRDHLPPDLKPWVNLWSAGQGVALIDDVPPVADLVDRLYAEYRHACLLPHRSPAAKEKHDDIPVAP